MSEGVAADEPEFRALFEAIPGLYLVVRPDAPRYTIVAVSDAYARATRTKRGEILGRGLSETFPDNASDSLGQVIRSRATDVGAIQRREERWWRTTSSPVLNADGVLTHIILELEDVTDLVRLERVAAEREKLCEDLSSFVDLAPDGIFLLDLQGRFTRVNEAACRMLGYTRDELLGKLAAEVIPEIEEQRLWRSRERLLRGDTERSEWTGVRKDGTTFPAAVSAKILPGGRWQAFVRDDSERKRLELQLQASNEELHRAQSVAKIGSWRLDVQKDELHWTEESYRIFGARPGSPLSYESFLERVHPDDRAYVDREWKAALGGEPYDIEHRRVSRPSAPA